MEMKKCKECGKLFVPKSARSQYCDGDHYRPCPICGKPVFAKYLSDPARRCKDCKNVKTSETSSIGESKAAKDNTTLNNTAGSNDNKTFNLTVDMIDRAKNLEIPENAIPFTREEALDGPLVVLYQGRTLCGFKWGHTYVIRTRKCNYGYEIEGVQDITEGSILDRAYINMASMISFNQNFLRVS